MSTRLQPTPTARPEDVERTRTPYGTQKQVGAGFYFLSSYVSISTHLIYEVDIDAAPLVYSSPIRAIHPLGRPSIAHPNCISSPLALSRQETRSPLHMSMSLNMMMRAYKIAVVGDEWN